MPEAQETWVQSLGQEDPLEEELATHFSILAENSHGQRSVMGCNIWGCKGSDRTEHTTQLCLWASLVTQW